MLRRYIVSVLLILCLAAAAGADVIYLKNGNRLEVEGARIDGEQVVFTVFNGTMKIDLAAVERIEKTTGPVAPNAGLRNAIADIPRPAANSADGATAPGQEGGDDQSAEDKAAELVEFYKTQKMQLERELKIVDDQIQTLRSVIYAKSSIFSDTTEERSRLTELEQSKRDVEQRLQNLILDARRAGLNPGQIREIENTRPQSSNQTGGGVTTIGAQRDSRDANVTMSDPAATSDHRSSSTVLGEGTDEKRSTSGREREK
jgi:hypothetical protein